MKEVPIFVINGFLESGKTTLINETLRDTEFNDGGKTLLILCEEGIEEYDDTAMKQLNVEIVTVEEQGELNIALLERCKDRYKPDRVMIEFNGTWNMTQLLQMKLPKGWLFGQILTLADATTFNNYWNNMRSVMGEQMKYSDVIIFNRCTKETDKTAIRRMIKPLNRQAQIMYEPVPGEELTEEEEVPLFDLSADPIVIEDDDYGLWYMDALDHPERYRGRKVQFRAMVYRDRNCSKGTFIPGRMAMTCCADDIAFIGFVCNVNTLQEALTQVAPKEKKWVMVTAEVQYEYRKEYQAEGPILTAKQLEATEPAESELVYFS